MKAVEFHPEAEAEFVAAAQHYEGLDVNIGDRILRQGASAGLRER